MKKILLFSIQIFALLISINACAQELTKSSFEVWGSCGMCKARIENVALELGAKEASWDKGSKMLHLSYEANLVSLDLVQQALAKVGHDTKDRMASEEAYAQLPACCQYERKSAGTATTIAGKCCVNKKCSGNAEDCRQSKDCENEQCCNAKSNCQKSCSKEHKCCDMKKCSGDPATCKSSKACKKKGCCKE